MVARLNPLVRRNVRVKNKLIVAACEELVSNGSMSELVNSLSKYDCLYECRCAPHVGIHFYNTLLQLHVSFEIIIMLI